MKPLYILVEGQTEEEFVKSLLSPHLFERSIIEVRPIKLSTSEGFRGGFVKYNRLRRDVEFLLKQRENSVISMFVDYFRIPNDIPEYEECRKIHNIDDRIICLQNSIGVDINSKRFLPYIQKYEFEALLFSSNVGFEREYPKIGRQTKTIIDRFSNPEEINDNPKTSPSNRLKAIIPQYNKVLDGNLLARDIGIRTILDKCPRFCDWVNGLVRLAEG